MMRRRKENAAVEVRGQKSEVRFLQRNIPYMSDICLLTSIFQIYGNCSAVIHGTQMTQMNMMDADHV